MVEERKPGARIGALGNSDFPSSSIDLRLCRFVSIRQSPPIFKLDTAECHACLT
jgi:hypothetical protein